MCREFEPIQFAKYAPIGIGITYLLSKLYNCFTMRSVHCSLLQFIDRMVGGEQEEQRPEGDMHPGVGEGLRGASRRGVGSRRQEER